MIFGNLGYDDFLFYLFIYFYFLKMNEPWANAPSLEHEFMSLEKYLIWSIFENNGAIDDFWKQVS